jgi:hypothetical protein
LTPRDDCAPSGFQDHVESADLQADGLKRKIAVPLRNVLGGMA